MADQMALGQVFRPSTSFYPVSIIAAMLAIHLHPHVFLIE